MHTAQAEGTTAAAGVYNETAFRGLDYILHQASLSGVRVLFTLADNWKTQDSKMNVRSSAWLLRIRSMTPRCLFSENRTMQVQGVALCKDAFTAL